MDHSVHIFLGANSGEGFSSLYGQLLGGRFDDLLILKGGPGCGKSSFMRAVAKELAGDNESIYVNCSGDPESLDGALFPSLRVGLVDGTAPHVLEPEYTVANERYVDLTRFYDVAGVKAARHEIAAHTDAYRAAYADAYRSLRAAAAVSAQRRAVVWAAADREKIARRIDALARREFKAARGARRGRVDYAFLGGLTHLGELHRFDTVDALCPRVYALMDDWGLAAGALEKLCDMAAEAGCDVLACRSADRPRELSHVLVPARGVAFVTSTARAPYPGQPFRRLRLGDLSALTRREKAQLRLTGRIEDALRAEAADALRRAKSSHDALEHAYNPFVDFDGVYALAAAEAARLRG